MPFRRHGFEIVGAPHFFIAGYFVGLMGDAASDDRWSLRVGLETNRGVRVDAVNVAESGGVHLRDVGVCIHRDNVARH